MDLLTQGLAGSVLAQSGGDAGADGRAGLRRLALLGFAAGLLPDLDVLIQASDDPLLQLEYHRQFTHSLAFAPFAALLLSALVTALPARWRGALRWRQVYPAALLALLSGGLLDACTSYGTQLLWPFSDQRVAWHVVAVIDPLFTLTLAIGALLAWRRGRALFARAALLVALGYLGLAAWQQQRATALALALAAERGHAGVIERHIVKPTLGNIVLWRSVYRAGGRYYADAVRVGLRGRVFPGASLPALEPARDLPETARQPASRLARDIARFARLSDGFLVRDPRHPDVVGDIRYALLPDGVAPLWGIAIDAAQPQRPVELRFFRDLDRAGRERFLAMLLDRG